MLEYDNVAVGIVSHTPFEDVVEVDFLCRVVVDVHICSSYMFLL